jgi:DNA-binding NarL/FixJ family response regulator
MLGPVRQYAKEKLEEADEGEEIRHQHAEFFLALAEEAGPGLRGPEDREWLERLEREHDNMRAALSWALERGEAELALCLGGALGTFWHAHGHMGEGRAMGLEQAIEYALSEEEPSATPPSSATGQASLSSVTPELPAGLTSREVEVLGLVASGMTSAKIAKELFLSPRTVETHLTSIYHKLGVTSRSAATRFALEHNLA